MSKTTAPLHLRELSDIDCVCGCNEKARVNSRYNSIACRKRWETKHRGVKFKILRYEEERQQLPWSVRRLEIKAKYGVFHE